MKSIKVTGEVQFIHLATGFWAIVSNDGEKYRPIHMPDQLKIEGKKVTVRLKPIQEEFSMMMWGTPAKIIQFET